MPIPLGVDHFSCASAMLDLWEAVREVFGSILATMPARVQETFVSPKRRATMALEANVQITVNPARAIVMRPKKALRATAMRVPAKRVTALNAIQMKVKAVKAIKVTVVTAATAKVTQGVGTIAGARIMEEE